MSTDRTEYLEEGDVVSCAYCGKLVLFAETYSPADEAICPECDTEVTGRIHPDPYPTTEPF